MYKFQREAEFETTGMWPQGHILCIQREEEFDTKMKLLVGACVGSKLWLPNDDHEQFPSRNPESTSETEGIYKLVEQVALQRDVPMVQGFVVCTG